MSTSDGGLLRSGDHVADAGLIDLWLAPGEEIRTPRIVVQFWQGADWIAAQNIWRRWMLAHNMPRPGGRLPAPMCPTQSSAYGPECLASALRATSRYLPPMPPTTSHAPLAEWLTTGG